MPNVLWHYSHDTQCKCASVYICCIKLFVIHTAFVHLCVNICRNGFVWVSLVVLSNKNPKRKANGSKLWNTNLYKNKIYGGVITQYIWKNNFEKEKRNGKSLCHFYWNHHFENDFWPPPFHAQLTNEKKVVAFVVIIKIYYGDFEIRKFLYFKIKFIHCDISGEILFYSLFNFKQLLLFFKYRHHHSSTRVMGKHWDFRFYIEYYILIYIYTLYRYM